MRADYVQVPGGRPYPLAVAAFVLSVVGVLAATWIVVGSDGDPSGVVWPLVVLPVPVCAAPVLVPGRAVRIGAAVALSAWCVLTGLSIGLLLLPAWLVLLGSVLREES